MRVKAIKALMLLTVFMALTAVAADRCTSWQAYKTSGPESRIFIKICEYESGGSGYYKFKNDNDKDVRISFVITFNDGSTWKGSTKIDAYSTTDGSACSKCASKKSGVDSWELTKIAFEGENGYW